MARSSSLSWLRPAMIALSLFSRSISAVGFSCDQVVADGAVFNLKPLAGTHSVVSESFPDDPGMANWTISINLCAALNLDKDKKVDHQCPQGTRVCALKQIWEEGDTTPPREHWVALAGDFSLTGTHLDVKPSRIKHSPSNSDPDKEGVLLELSGGRDPFQPSGGKKGVKQKAIVEMICNKEKTGWEPESNPNALRIRDESESNTTTNNALQFISYGPEPVDKESWGVLRLKWETKYACEDTVSEAPASESWGFFTWMILIVFLAISAYVVFGSWLNYTRYGVRGFDAVPHSDALRDIPYFLKDIFRRFQGGGSRGGYSAV